MGGVPGDVIYVVRMGTRIDACRANLHLMDTSQHLLKSREPRGSKNGNAGSGTHALFGLPDPDNLIDPYGGQLSAITAPGDVRHCVLGGHLNVPWAECRKVGYLTKTDYQNRAGSA